MSNSEGCSLNYKQVSLTIIGLGAAATGILAITATGFYLTYNVLHEIRNHSASLQRSAASLAQIQTDIREIRSLVESYPGFRWLQPANPRAQDFRQNSGTANNSEYHGESANRLRKQSNQRPGQNAGCKAAIATRDGPRYSFRSPILSPNASDYEDAFSVIEKSKTSSEELAHQASQSNEKEELPIELILDNENNTKSKPTETFGDFFKTVDELHEGSEQKKLEAYEILQQKFCDFPENPEILWRLARSLVIVAELEERQGKKEKKREVLEKGCELAHKCLELNSSAEGHKWFAIISGMLGQFQSVSEKIKGGFIFKEHIEKAIVLKPDDSSLHHLLGRWSFEVSQLGWMERKAASTFFGTPPSSTMNDALKCFLKANELERGVWKDNILWIAKCLVAMKRIDEAKEWVDQALNAETMESDDPNVIKELISIKIK